MESNRHSETPSEISSASGPPRSGGGGAGGGWEGGNPYNMLMGIRRGLGSHFHDWVDYDGVAFSIELLVMGSHF